MIDVNGKRFEMFSSETKTRDDAKAVVFVFRTFGENGATISLVELALAAEDVPYIEDMIKTLRRGIESLSEHGPSTA